MKSRKLHSSKSHKSTIYATSRNRDNKSSPEKLPKPKKEVLKTSMTLSEREEKDMMIERIQLLDQQYKKLSQNYAQSSRNTKNLEKENQALKQKYRRSKEENKELEQRLGEETKRSKTHEEGVKTLKTRYQQLEIRCMLQREKRLLLEGEREKWQNQKGRMLEEYQRILEVIDDVKAEICD